MRKSLFITVVLLVICIWGVTSAHGAVNAKKDAVTFGETVLFGDKSAAENLTVNVSTHCDNHLFWDTEYVVGEIPQIETDFHFSQEEEYNRDVEYPHSGVQFDIYGNFGISSDGGIDLDDLKLKERFGGMDKILRDVASRTVEGSTHTENVLFADYYDFYPIMVSLDIPAYWEEMVDEDISVQQTWSDPSATINREIANYFRIPVSENHQLEVSVIKDVTGAILEIDVHTLNDTGPEMWTRSVITSNACYFVFNNRTWDGGVVDTDYIPGGYGVYCLPFIRDPDTEVNMVSADTLGMVYALDEEIEIADLALNDDESKLLLITRENRAFWLTVLDIETANELQKIQIVECLDDDYIWNTLYYDDFLVVLSSGERFSVIEVNAIGDYERKFIAETTDASALGFFISYNTVMCWDGEKLAMASFQEREFRHNVCGFYLSIYDETGPIYVGRYDSSLDVSSDIEYTYRCRPVDSDPISVSW